MRVYSGNKMIHECSKSKILSCTCGYWNDWVTDKIGLINTDWTGYKRLQQTLESLGL